MRQALSGQIGDALNDDLPIVLFLNDFTELLAVYLE